MICVDGEQKCVDDLGSEGAIFAKCQEAMLAGRLPELKGLMEKDGRLRMGAYSYAFLYNIMIKTFNKMKNRKKLRRSHVKFNRP